MELLNTVSVITVDNHCVKYRRCSLPLLPIHHSCSISDIARQLCISEKTVLRYISKFEQTGDVIPTIQQHGPQKLLGDFEQLLLLRLISEDKAIYLHEIQSKLFGLLGVQVSTATILRTLK